MMPLKVSLGVLVVAGAVTSISLVAQTPSRPALSGTWALNVEESSASSDVVRTAPTPPPPDPPMHPVGPGGATDGVGGSAPWVNPGKSGSMISPKIANALNQTPPEKDTGKDMTPEQKLVLELTTPPMTLSLAATGTQVTVTREGRTDTYMTDGREEKHRMVNGTIKAKTWETDSGLRQELTVSKTISFVRTFEVDDHNRLIVITRPADDKSLEFQTQLVSRLGVDGSAKGLKRAVYDAEGK